MKDENNIQKTIAELGKNLKTAKNNKINQVKKRITSEKINAENKSKGLSISELKNELQCIMYSNKIGKYLISFCEYIMYTLAGLEIITFFGQSSRDYGIADGFFELSILELLSAITIGIICSIKGSQASVLIYTVTATFTYFFRLSEGSDYKIINLAILLSAIFIDIYIIKKYIKGDKKIRIKQKSCNLFKNKNNREYEDKTQIDTMIRCKKCGNICLQKDNFCVNCGRKLDSKENSNSNSIKEQRKDNSIKNNKEKEREDYTVKLNKNDIMNNIQEKIIKQTDDDFYYR